MMLFNSKKRKLIACALLTLFGCELLTPTAAYALTSGPSQPEMQGFVPAGASEMVNLFTGDFTYNIPLMDVGGYPINLAYTGNSGMETEASWVGLGWSLNPGAMNRSVRGLPDDFDGDQVIQTMSTRPLIEVGERKGQHISIKSPNLGVNLQIPGAPIAVGANISGRMSFTNGYARSENNYTGSGVDQFFDRSASITPGVNLGVGITAQGHFFGLSTGLSQTYGWGKSNSNGTGGIRRNPTQSYGYNVSFGLGAGKAGDMSVGKGLSYGKSNSITSRYSTRNGLTQATVANKSNFGGGISVGGPNVSGRVGFGSSSGSSSSINFGTQTYMPLAPYNSVAAGINSSNWSGEVNLLSFIQEYAFIDNSHFHQVKVKEVDTLHAIGYLNAENARVNRAQKQIMDVNREQGTPFLAATMPNLPISSHTFDVFSATGQGMQSSFQPRRREVAAVMETARYQKRNSVNQYERIGKVQIPTPPGPGALLTNVGEELLGNLLPGEKITGSGQTVAFTGQGPWLPVHGNGAFNKLQFKKQKQPTDEPVYFQKMGEINPYDQEFYDQYGGEKPGMLPVGTQAGENAADAEVYLSKRLVVFPGNNQYPMQTLLPDTNYRQERQSRQELFSFLNASEASSVGVQEKLNDYKRYPLSGYSQKVIDYEEDRVTSKRQAHHISEASVLKPNGSRYVYGIPAYNNYQKEVTFNASGNSFSLCKRGVVYDENQDNTIKNNNGRDHFYQSTELPAYAHSFLLTSILSPDYVDKTGNGPSVDDYGNYTRFNYSKVYEDFGWRTPYSRGDTNDANFPLASYAPGYFCDQRDDMGRYTYGEKEVWYVHSIESKNYIAEFILEDREDGYGVIGEDGMIDTSKPLQKLSRIDLYVKEDRANNVPIQSVHFEYDYSLCDGVPNNINQNGKLTLKKVWVSYGNSKKGYLNPYEFKYTNNYDYQAGDVNGWGGYQPNDCNLPMEEFPFAEQDTALANDYTAAWMLNQIDLPSGGRIDVEFEADDYAYVQDKRAMRMFKIAGFGATKDAFDPFAPNTALYQNETESNPYVFIKLDEALTGTKTEADSMLKAYGVDLKHLYFRCKVNLKTGTDDYEYVPGYAEVEGYGVVGSSPYQYGYLKLKEVSMLDPEAKPEGLPQWTLKQLPSSPGTVGFVNPIAKTAWQFTRTNLNRKIFPELRCDRAQADATKDLGTILSNGLNSGLQSAKTGAVSGAWDGFTESIVDDIFGNENIYADINSVKACHDQYLQQQFGMDQAIISAGGLNLALREKYYCQHVDLSKSWVKLNDPDQRKIGGGYRVKSVKVTDGWGSMGGSDASYQTNYSYDMENEAGEIISSGVAAYEPAALSEENPNFKPRFYEVEHLMYPDDVHYLDRPIGESYFPGPTVGYRQVRVESDHPSTVKRSGTGHLEYQFYTAKDFPVIVRKTPMRARARISEADYTGEGSLIGGVGNTDGEDHTVDVLGVSQGFSVIVNDMHGKPRHRRMMDENGVEISAVEYAYRSKPYQSGSYELDNEVRVVDHTGKVTNAIMGQSMEIVAENRNKTHYESSYMNTSGYALSSNLSLGLSISQTGPLPTSSIGLSLSFINSSTSNYTIRKSKTSVFTKVIQKHGLLEWTTVRNQHSNSRSQNHLRDKETGQVVVSSSSNDFKDKVYFINYPAYWAYEGMAPAYQNLGTSFEDVDIDANGKLDISDAEIYFYEGDELLIDDGTTYKGWVMETDSTGAVCIEKDGTLLGQTQGASVKIIRSGHRNQQVASAGGFSTINNAKNDITPTKALSASATEYSDQWQTYAAWDEFPAQSGCNAIEGCDTVFSPCGLKTDDVVNPFVKGLRGVWKPKTSHAYQVDRIQDDADNDTELRYDGQYHVDNNTFWNFGGAGMTKNNNASNWISGGEVTLCGPHDGALESVDALGIYTSVLPGYNHTAPKAQAANARLKEIAYDGFEDYEIGGSSCHDNHFNFRDYQNKLTQNHAHTGRYSLKVSSNDTVGVARPISTSYALNSYWEAPYKLQTGDRIPAFSPEHSCETQKYLLSCWVKVGEHPGSAVSYDDVQVQVRLDCSVLPNPAEESRSAIIDGWQKIDLVFELENTHETRIDVEVVNTGSTLAYLDDIRIHPYLAAMGSYVYDAETLRLLATLDDRNFATFFQYDDEGGIVSTRVETERGIRTVAESRGGLKKD